MNKVLVTGATGFIGQHLVPYLLEQQLSIRVLIRDSKKAVSFPHQVKPFIGDLTEPKTLLNACESIDTIFHLGGYAHAWEENHPNFSNEHYINNFQSTKNILEAAIQSGVKKFIFFSSVKAVADAPHEIDENWQELPNSAYGIAKREAEKIVLAAQSKGMHVCILRLALVYGPGWKGNLATMLKAIDRGIFLPPPKTDNKRSMVSVEDVCRAALLVANHPKANGEIFFVTDGLAYSTYQLYVLMRRALGKPIPKWVVPLPAFQLMAKIGDFAKKLTKRRMPFDSQALTKLFGSAHYNSKKIQLNLGFQPTDSLEKILPLIIENYKANI